MTAAGRHFQMEMGADGSFLKRIARLTEKRIIKRADEQGGCGDLRDKGPGAVQRPVGLSILETMDGAGVTVVEFGETAHLHQIGEIQFPGEKFVFEEDFPLHVFHEPAHVDGIAPPAELRGGIGQITGNGKSDGAVDFSGYVLPQIFKSEIATKTKADEIDLRGGMDFLRVGDDRAEILRGSAVVKTFQAVCLTTAAAEIPGEDIPPCMNQGTGHALDVCALGRTFQSVGNDGEAGAGFPRPIEIQEIPIREFQALALSRDLRYPADERRDDGLEMPSR